MEEEEEYLEEAEEPEVLGNSAGGAATATFTNASKADVPVW